MLYALCLKVGFPHPDYLLSTLTSRQLAGWEAYFSIYPFDNTLDDIRNAKLAAVIANCHRVDREPFTISDFMPTYIEEEIDEETKKKQLRRKIQRVMKSLSMGKKNGTDR